MAVNRESIEALFRAGWVEDGELMTTLRIIQRFLAMTSVRMVIAYRQFPEPVRLGLTAVIGAGIGWVTYEIIYWFTPAFRYRPTISWVLAFSIGVMRQHALHQTLTFPGQTSYLSGLGRAYLFYAVSALSGALLNFTLTVRWGIDHRLAWLACLLLTGLFSLLFLKRMVFKGGESA